MYDYVHFSGIQDLVLNSMPKLSKELYPGKSISTGMLFFIKFSFQLKESKELVTFEPSLGALLTPLGGKRGKGQSRQKTAFAKPHNMRDHALCSGTWKLFDMGGP